MKQTKNNGVTLLQKGSLYKPLLKNAILYLLAALLLLFTISSCSGGKKLGGSAHRDVRQL